MLGTRLRAYENGYIASSITPAYHRLQELARVAGVSRAFTLSVKLDLYTLLRELKEREGVDGVSALDIAAHLGFKPDLGLRGVTDWLDILVSLALLNRTGAAPPNAIDVDDDINSHGPDSAPSTSSTAAPALYSNTAEADTYLAKQSPDYMGGHAVLYHDRTFPQLTYLEHSLRTGVQPEIARAVIAPVKDTFSGTASTSAVEGATGGDPVAFALGMTGCNKPAFKSLATKFDFSQYKTLGDIGGSAGVLSCCVAAAHPHMTCTTYDLPAVHEAAVQYVQQQDLAQQVEVADIDFFTDSSFPCHDVITMSMVLHDWGLEKKKLLMKKAYDALPPGGALIVLEVLIDDQRCANVWGLMISLDMLMEFEAETSFDFTFQEFSGWAKGVGFSRTELIRLTGPNSAAVAYK